MKQEESNYSRYCGPQQIERDFNNLIGIINGVSADQIFHEAELSGLLNWILETKKYENRQPYKGLVEILSKAITDYVIDEEEKQDILWYCQEYTTSNAYYNCITSSIQELSGILDGISLDGSINEKELIYLTNWLDEHRYLENHFPYDELNAKVQCILTDGEISQIELRELFEYCRMFKAKRLFDKDTNDDLVAILSNNIFEFVDEVRIDSKFCITGGSKLYKRDEIKQAIKVLGGDVVNSVTQKTDYLIICEERNSCWAYSNYGRKVEQAIKLKKKGAFIRIVHIEDIYPFIKIIS